MPLARRKFATIIKTCPKKPLVSVIIPVFNNLAYLGACLSSVLTQTLEQIEIIIINDGSTDPGVSSKLKQISAADPRIRLIVKANAGYGHSMNLGISQAVGKYIGIVESDDYIDKYMYEKLLAEAGDDIDIIRGGAVFFATDSKKQQLVPVTGSRKPVSIFSDKDAYFRGAPLNPTGIYRREFLLKKQISFSETPGASFQDIGFHFLTSILANEIRLLPGCFYYYRRDNPDSSINCQAKAEAAPYEYARLYAFLEAHTQLMAQNIGYFYLRKFISYKFTLARIHESLRPLFLSRFQAEWRKGHDSNEIDYSLFEDAELAWVEQNLLI